METNKLTIEPVTISEILNLNSWDRPRSSDELQAFIARRESQLDVEL